MKSILQFVTLGIAGCVVFLAMSDRAISQNSGKQYYVSPAGSPRGDGSTGSPWDLQTALNHPAVVRPGDTIWLRGGTYNRPVTFNSSRSYMFRSVLRGTPAAPIVVRGYAGERAIIDGYYATPRNGWSALEVNGSDTWYWDFEVTNSNPNRTPLPETIAEEGVTVHGARTKFINLLVHDNSWDGIGFWADAPDSELYGNLIFNNGDIDSTQNKFWAHGIYIQNRQGTKIVQDNIVFQNFSTCIAPHGTAQAAIDNVTLERNVNFNCGSLALNASNPDLTNLGRNLWIDLLGTPVIQNLRLVDNESYYSPAFEPPANTGRGSLFILQPTNGSVIRGNRFIRGEIIITNAQTNGDFSSNEILAEKMTGWTSALYPNNTYYKAKPSRNLVLVRPNKYDSNRANVVIYNWENRGSVDVDISSLGWNKGDVYELRNVQDYFGDVIQGSYEGNPISIPTAGRKVKKLDGWASTPPSTFPEFGVFVITRSPRSTGINFSGGANTITAGLGAVPAVGYGRVQIDPGSVNPSGLAIFGFRSNDVLVGETSVPASPLIQTGRIYAEAGGSVQTGIGVANPSSQDATLSFFFTDSAGTDFGQGTIPIPAGQQIARFLKEPPFSGPLSMTGTFTFSSSVPVAVIALRGFVNERDEFLMTTLPVTPLSAQAAGGLIFPDFADGGGWTTQLSLVNPTDQSLGGSLQFFGQGSTSSPGQPVNLTVNGQTGSTFSYTIAPRSSAVFRTSGAGTASQGGSIRITPAAGSTPPAGLGIFRFGELSVTETETGVPALPAGSAFRLYAETNGVFGEPGSIQTGIAIANPSASSSVVNFELLDLTGASLGASATTSIPGNGQITLFLNQIAGFQSIQNPFQGVLRISTPSASGIVVIGLRARYNERREFLVTTTPPVDEAAPPTSTELVFPYLVDGGNYTTQLILFSVSPGQTSKGIVRFFSQSGNPLGLSLR